MIGNRFHGGEFFYRLNLKRINLYGPEGTPHHRFAEGAGLWSVYSVESPQAVEYLRHYREAFIFRQFVDSEILRIKGSNVLDPCFRGKADNSGVGKVHRQVCVFLH